MEPKFIIDESNYTSSGSLRSDAFQRVANLLLRGGKVIVPSDTCYSLTAIADDPSLFQFYKKALKRRDFPISVAFSNVLHAQKFAHIDMQVASIIEQFTPGPITIVCKIKKRLKEQAYSENVLGALDETIGVRIPNSVVERDLSTVSFEFPNTSVAIRNTEHGIVQDFDEAIKIVSNAMSLMNESNWCAIKTKHDFVKVESTVVKMVDGDGTFDIIRNGQVVIDNQFNEAMRIIPNWHYRAK